MRHLLFGMVCGESETLILTSLYEDIRVLKLIGAFIYSSALAAITTACET